MSALLQQPPPGTVVAAPPGGIRGKPPGGFVYPYWLPQIPGTIVAVPKPADPAHECPDAPLPDPGNSAYYGSGYDDSISSRTLTKKSLRDCELKYCHLQDCTLVDCLLIGCTVNEGSLKDVELRTTQCYKAQLHDLKAISNCKFGICKITEGDITSARFYQCDVASSEIKDSSTWITKVDDCTLKNITAYKGSKFTSCGGDVPTVEDDGVPEPPAPPIAVTQDSAASIPKAPFIRPVGKMVYSSSDKKSDTLLDGYIISGLELDDCELRNCFVERSTIKNSKVVNCTGNEGTYKDVELVGTSLYQATINDVKASGDCKFGTCTIHEGNLQNSFYDKCTVTSSEVTNGAAWDTKFRDATLKNVKFEGKCKFAVCGGDFPKKDDSSDEEMGDMPAPYQPAPYTPPAYNTTAATAAPPSSGGQPSGGYVLPSYGAQPQASNSDL